MKRNTIVIQLLVLLAVMQLIHSQSITKTLQNGNGSYEGCKDSYTSGCEADINFSDEQYFVHCNCQS